MYAYDLFAFVLAWVKKVDEFHTLKCQRQEFNTYGANENWPITTCKMSSHSLQLK
jgi:hypothetical protein